MPLKRDQGGVNARMQLCVNAAIPAPSGGIDAESMYLGMSYVASLRRRAELIFGCLDTEGSFTPERIREICQGAINLLSRQQQSTRSDSSSVV